jgi:hypothetical protein
MFIRRLSDFRLAFVQHLSDFHPTSVRLPSNIRPIFVFISSNFCCRFAFVIRRLSLFRQSPIIVLSDVHCLSHVTVPSVAHRRSVRRPSPFHPSPVTVPAVAGHRSVRRPLPFLCSAFCIHSFIDHIFHTIHCVRPL